VAQKPGATAATRADSGHSILVIDDEASIREVLFILLRRDGHDVETVADGLAALERLAERDFDLIMTDVRMPGVDGIEFFNRVRAWNPAVAARIIFTTGDIVNPTTRDFLASVPNLHFQKPFSLADVREMIAALLQH
jgi:CheY-like chemotaxis protein